MSYSKELQYRTFNDLLNDVSLDFKNYSLNDLIEPAALIKIARKVNYDLGFRIYKTQDTVLDIEHYKAKLPDNYNVLNFALMCGHLKVVVPNVSGTHVSEVPCPPITTVYQQAPPEIVVSGVCQTEPDGCNPCDVPVQKCCISKCGENYSLVQTVGFTTKEYSALYPLKIKRSKWVSAECMNLGWTHCLDEAWIQDGWIHTSFKTGKLYINYEANMEDEDGNVIVPDHEMLNEYYEYALKDRILENLYFNGEDVERKMMMIKDKLRVARVQALSMVNTPDFGELQATWNANRKAQYGRYYDMFSSYSDRSYNPIGRY